MMHEPRPQPNLLVDRLLLPLALPLLAAGATAGLIIGIGSLLLAFGGQHSDLGFIRISTPVGVALFLALGVLVFCAALAATWGRARR